MDRVHPFESIAAPVVVMRNDQFLYANAAWGRLFGLDPRALAGRSSGEVIGRTVLPEDQRWVESLSPAVSELWVHIPTAEGPRLALVRRMAGPDPGEQTFLVLVSPEEAECRALAQGLVACQARLMTCRDEREVLCLAIETLAAQGLYCGFMWLEGDQLRQGPLHQSAGLLAELEPEVGPVSDFTYALEAVPHVRRMFEERRAVFHPDMHAAVQAVLAPAVSAAGKRWSPVLRGVDAPVFVGDAPYGMLAVQSATLSPAMAAVIELYARSLGSALENVRHHRAAGERLKELTRLQDELVARERLAVLGEASAVLAHEVRNPVGAILNATSLLRKQLERPVDPTVLRVLEEESGRLDQLIHTLLHFARPLTPRPRQLVVAELVREVATAGSRRGWPRVRVEVLGGDPPVSTDPDLLQILLENLLRNAAEASPPGGEVRVEVEHPRGELRLAVVDQGPGIPAGDRRRIFQPFFTTRATGTGLGLALVERIATALGGLVEVHSATPAGTRFEVRLPR